MGNHPILGLCIAVMVFSLTVEGEIRCYCNKVDCVATAYMCKSQLGICYSIVKFKDSNRGPPTESTIVSGCADTLDQDPRIRTCAGHAVHHNEAELRPNGSESQTVTNSIEQPESFLFHNNADKVVSDNSNNVDPSAPELTCCTQDMCNYKDSVDIQISIRPPPNGGNGLSQDRHNEIDKPHKDLWFKAAVIAVPIAGGFILILLVLLAVRMLRSDSRHHRRLIQIRRERSLTKAQLYVTDHFIDKEKNKNTTCDSNSQSNQQNSHSHVHQSQPKREHSGHAHSHSHSTSSSHRNSNSHHPHHSHSHSHSQHHAQHHKNNNCPKITTNKDGHTYEQIVTQTNDVNSNTCGGGGDTLCQTSYPSIVVWGQPPKQDVAAVV